jgi:hypothetical protein
MTKRRLPHESITEDRVVALCMEGMREASNPGLCLACGFEQDGCEPDAENYTCESCGESCVMGAEQILISGAYHPDRPERTGHRTASQTTKAVDGIDIEDETARLPMGPYWHPGDEA